MRTRPVRPDKRGPRRGLFVVVSALMTLAGGVSFAQEPQPLQEPAPANTPEAPASGKTAQTSSGSVLSSFMEPFEYDPQGRKDPFAKPMLEKPLAPGAFHGPVLPLQRFRLEELVLTGIIWDVSRPRAMVKDPSNQIHVIGPYAKLGNQNGYVAAIREGEIVVIETYEEQGKLLSAPRIVKLSSGGTAAGGAAGRGN